MCSARSTVLVWLKCSLVVKTTLYLYRMKKAFCISQISNKLAALIYISSFVGYLLIGISLVVLKIYPFKYIPKPNIIFNSLLKPTFFLTSILTAPISFYHYSEGQQFVPELLGRSAVSLEYSGLCASCWCLINSFVLVQIQMWSLSKQKKAGRFCSIEMSQILDLPKHLLISISPFLGVGLDF